MAQQSNLFFGHLSAATLIMMLAMRKHHTLNFLSVDISTKQTISGSEDIRLLEVPLFNKIVRDHL